MTDKAYSLLAELEKVKDLSHPPVHLWHPDTVTDIDMVIERDGTWIHEGRPITRPRLARLFSTVLRREGDEYFLVTPVEKCRITVEDAPFTAVLLDVRGEGEQAELRVTTNMAETVLIDADHPLRLEAPDTEEPKPYVTVRDGLDALVARPVYYELAGLLAEAPVDGEAWLGVWSAGTFFPLMSSAAAATED